MFWDRDGILLIGYLPKGRTIIAESYSSLPVQLKDILGKTSAGIHEGNLVLAQQCTGLPRTCNP